jgi:acyl dehydratase
MDQSHVGREFPAMDVEVSAKEIARFAAAIGDTDPVYRDLGAARAAGYPGIPLPPTYGSFLLDDRPDPHGMLALLGIDLRKLLHAEQRFEYHAPVFAGDRLTLTDRVADRYLKKGGSLEFVVLDCEARKATGELALTIRRVLVVRHA